MLLVAIAWLYVVLMVAVVEATSRNGTVFGATVTLLLYGVLPIGLVAYLFFSPARRRTRRADSAAGTATFEAGADGKTTVKGNKDWVASADADAIAGSASDADAAVPRFDPDRGDHAARIPLAPKRKEP